MATLKTQALTPGTAYTLTASGVTDQNGIALDNTTATANALLTASDGNGAVVLNNVSVPYVSPGNFHVIVYGQNIPAGLPQRLDGRLYAVDGTTLRLAQQVRVAAAVPANATYQPLVGLTVSLAGFTFNGVAQTSANATGTVTMTDGGGNGTVQVNAAALIYSSVSGAWTYLIDGSLMVAKGQMLIVAQMYDLGGNQTLSQRWLATADW